MTAAATVALPGVANAQFYSPFSYQQPRYRPRKKPVRRSSRSSRSSNYTQAKREPAGEVMMLISLKRQRIQVYDQQGLLAQAPISSGRRGYRTPTGIFTILQKNKRHFSNLYNSAPMPNMQRITWSGVAMHAGALPGYPASHGCIRLPYSFSSWLFGITNMHGRVIVSDDALKPPQTIANDKLFRGMPDAYANALFSKASEASRQETADGIEVAATKKPHNVVNDVHKILGITQAHAAVGDALTEAEKERLSRIARLRQKHIEKRVSIDAELLAAQAEFDRASAAVKGTAGQLDDNKAALKSAEAELSERIKYARKLQADAKAAHQKLEQFDRKYYRATRNQRADTLYKLAKLEKALDQNAISLTDEVIVSDQAVERQKSKIVGLKANVELAVDFHNEAKADLKAANTRLAEARKADEDYKRAEKNRTRPVSVFISGKTQRLYVRQAWQPLFDVPVRIESPREPLGTHLFTAAESPDGNSSFDWNVVAVQSQPGNYISYGDSRKQKKRSSDKTEQIVPSKRVAELASNALDRIEIPQHVRDRIENLMRPGSSLIISDHPVSNETGSHTDFVILTR